MNKILGIAALFLVIFIFTMSMSHDFLSANNLQNFLKWTAIFSLMSIGVAFVIMTGGIDLSIGSVVAMGAVSISFLLGFTYFGDVDLAATRVAAVDEATKSVSIEGDLSALSVDDRLLFTSEDGAKRFLTIRSIEKSDDKWKVSVAESPKRLRVGDPLAAMKRNYSIPFGIAVLTVIGLTALIGVIHGLLITKMEIQPFVVTLCTYLIYRGLTRFIAGDRPTGFGARYDSIKHWAQGHTGSIPIPFLKYISDGHWSAYKVDREGAPILENGQRVPVELFEWVQIPNPLIVLILTAVVAAIFLNRTVFGRYLLALGSNEQATRFSGIKTDRIKILAYVICSALAGIAGIFFALDLGTISPSNLGNGYELYAIAGAVLGGCSLRGGEGNIIGVIIGASVMVLIKNAINLLGVVASLEQVVIGGVILGGVMADELSRKFAAYRRARQQAAVASKT